MAFGLSITGNDTGGNFIVQDTDLNMINYQVVATGVASSVSTSSFANGRLFINANNDSNNLSKFITIEKSTSTYSFKRLTLTGNLGSNLTGVSMTSCSVNYLILKQMDAISNSGGNYGLQLLTSAGVVAFDTRRLLTNTSFFFTTHTGPNTVSGDGGTISADGDSYADSEVFFEFATDSASAIRWRGTGIGTSRVEYLHFRQQGGGRGGGGSTTSYINNFGTIVLGKIR